MVLFSSLALHAASVNDGISLIPSLEDFANQDSMSVVPSSNPSGHEATLIPTPVTADGVVMGPKEMAPSQPTPVPESVGAIFVALFGFVLMLRRR